MAEKTTASEGAPRRKREAPTIDLTAKDVTPPAATPEPPPAEQQAAADTPASPPPPLEEPTPTAAEEAPASSPDASAPRRDARSHHIAAGLAGGVVAAAVFGALWYGGALPARQAAPTDNGGEIAALKQQIQDLQSRQGPAADSKAVDAVTQRVARMEDALKNLPRSDTSIADRLTAAENAMKSLGVALSALNQRSDDASANAARAREQAEASEKAIAQLRGSVQDVAKDASAAVAPEQFAALTQRITALEQASKAAREDLDNAVAQEKATRLALGAAALRAAVASGAPFAAELAQAKALGASERYTAPLASFSESGVPTAAALAQELRAALPQMVKLAGTGTPSGGFFERLQANASKLVKVTPVDTPPGDDVPTVLARLEIVAARADIAAALADLAKLPEATRAPAQNFIAKAKAREAALAAARNLAADTARALGSR
jgi:hypothetical protein